jgi:2,4-diaminopentanoate dehydrogenase
MTHRVIQWATGTVGVHAVPGHRRPSRPRAGRALGALRRQGGRDAGELCGTEPLGVLATQDADALLYDAPDCVCYMAHRRAPRRVLDDLCRMLAAGQERGQHLVRAAAQPEGAAGPGVLDRLEAACLEGGSSFYTSGIDPGYGNAGAAIGALALCKEVPVVRMMEIVNYATWDNPFTMFEIMGFGKPDTSQSLLLSPGSTAWRGGR